MRTAVALLMLIGTLAAAHAFGLGEGNRFGRLGSFKKSGGSSPPPVCSNQLDFSQACNSQYLL